MIKTNNNNSEILINNDEPYVFIFQFYIIIISGN